MSKAHFHYFNSSNLIHLKRKLKFRSHGWMASDILPFARAFQLGREDWHTDSCGLIQSSQLLLTDDHFRLRLKIFSRWCNTTIKKSTIWPKNSTTNFLIWKLPSFRTSCVELSSHNRQHMCCTILICASVEDVILTWICNWNASFHRTTLVFK